VAGFLGQTRVRAGADEGAILMSFNQHPPHSDAKNIHREGEWIEPPDVLPDQVKRDHPEEARKALEEWTADFRELEAKLAEAQEALAAAEKERGEARLVISRVHGALPEKAAVDDAGLPNRVVGIVAERDTARRERDEALAAFASEVIEGVRLRPTPEPEENG